MGRSPLMSRGEEAGKEEVGEEEMGTQRAEVVVLFAAPGAPMVGLTSSACRA